jgi:hypothetical protein
MHLEKHSAHFDKGSTVIVANVSPVTMVSLYTLQLLGTSIIGSQLQSIKVPGLNSQLNFRVWLVDCAGAGEMRFKPVTAG